jgi:uncharacterized protein YecT (DUF1311 family)
MRRRSLILGSSMKLSLSLLLFLIVPCAFAGNERVMKEFARRTGIHDMTEKEVLEGCDGAQMSMNLCAEYHFIERDLQLNDEYRKLQKNLDGRDLKKLIAAQRAWISFRDLDCDFSASDVDGGSMHPMVSLNCQQELTEQRIKQLKTYNACTSVRGECPP